MLSAKKWVVLFYFIGLLLKVREIFFFINSVFPCRVLLTRAMELRLLLEGLFDELLLWMIALAKPKLRFPVIIPVLLLLDSTANLFLNLKCPLTELHRGLHTGKLRRIFVSVYSALCAACLVNPISLNLADGSQYLSWYIVFYIYPVWVKILT